MRAARLERPHRLLPRRRSDALDHDVGLDRPLRRALSCAAAAPISRACARFCSLRLVTSTRRAHHRSQRQRGARHTRTDADDQQGVTRLKACPPQHAVGGEVGQRERSALLPGSCRWSLANVALGRDRGVAVTAPAVLAVDHEAGAHRAVVAPLFDVGNRRHSGIDHHLVADSDRGDARADRRHHAGHVAAGHVRQGWFRHATRHPQVHVVQRAGNHTNRNVVGSEIGKVDRPPSIGTGRFVEDPCMHGVRP